jgi:hypothetical protein
VPTHGGMSVSTIDFVKWVVITVSVVGGPWPRAGAYEAATVRVHLDEVVTDYRNLSTGLVGSPHTGPQFVGPGGALVGEVHELGVVVLSQPVALPRYGRLPPVGYLESLVVHAGVKGVGLTVVGYGIQDVLPMEIAETRRLVAEVWVLSLKTPLTGGAQVGTTNARGTGGGICYGDSGGPFLSGGDTVVGVTKWALNLQTCDGGPAFAYRIDTASGGRSSANSCPCHRQW